MILLNKIYTKTGDDGTTALVDGSRVKKNDVRVEAYGTVDETNASIGILRLYTQNQYPVIDTMLSRIQNDLFDLGADLANPEAGENTDSEALQVIESQVARLESEIDQLNSGLTPLHSFVLPGGGSAAAHFHLSRTIARRAERLIVQMAQDSQQNLNPFVIQYMNRVSDFLFVAARVVNHHGDDDVLWVPGKNR
ncbi:cob(I)yrinic acid a,c-diamide adenosyltransferase [Candidatus Endowatersipora endosymbiont of Watersipora subatra]|uniref:cob(I)yrinic acid a,c-diamide adenosyltransferase n=1 Tax=Candidatus Endowatersipora endosymbiont of Watersipora subatra TaxID=3077946 RepID=UPI00312CA9A4